MICKRCGQKHTDNSVVEEYCVDCVEDFDNLSILWLDVQRCQACPLHRTVTNKVVGKGFWGAKILFVGEAPGRHEDEEGIPFVGAAGKLLDVLIIYAGLPDNSFFVTNVVRCRPPNNRVPSDLEVEACSPFLKRTIEYVKPRVIVTLGYTATKRVLALYKREITEKMMGKIRGTIYELPQYVTLIPTYHPAAIIYNGRLMDIVKEDFKLIGKLYEAIKRYG